MRDDSGSYAVFAEQGSSASQMTAAKVMDVKARVPDCARQAADAVSAYTQVKMNDAPKLMKNFQVRISRYMVTSSTTQSCQNHGPAWKTQSFLLSEICMVTHLQASCGKDHLKSSIPMGMGRSTKLGMSICSSKQGLFLSVYVDDIKMAGRKAEFESHVEEFDGAG